MRKLFILLAGAAFAALASWAVAQSVIQDNISGNECWNAGQGPGGPSTGFLCSDTVRNSRQHVAMTITTSLTFGTGALANLSDGGQILITAQPTVAPTFTLPPNPVPDGAIYGFCNVTSGNFATTAISLTTSLGQTLNTAVAPTTQAAGTCALVQFDRATTTWFRIQ